MLAREGDDSEGEEEWEEEGEDDEQWEEEEGAVSRPCGMLYML